MSMSRRTFITSTAAIASSIEAMAEIKTPAAAGYALKVMATNWGFQGGMADFCSKAKKDGYDGIEVWLPDSTGEREEIFREAKKNGLLIALLYGGGDHDFSKHLAQFSEGITAAAALNPIYINCHSGKDFYSFEQNKACIDFSLEVSAKTGIPVYHETHRGRALFAAHTTRDFLEKIPGLRLTLDASHWCNVHESLLADQLETMSVVLPKVSHIHARIGHAEGPQVNDPRAPEWAQAVNAHFTWWDGIVERFRKEGKPLTVLAEFGPPDYMPTLPYTRQPLSDQWSINVHMMQLFRKRYGS